MKIGILTFHWGTNYGGVLQAYALQTFLKNTGFDVQIINFAPHTFRDSFVKCFYSKNPKTIFENITNYFKERNIKQFRNKHLIQTKRYFTPGELIANPPKMDVYITGSDQVWNPYGLKSNEKIYFLPYGSESCIKLSYAASFGVTDYPVELLKQIAPLLKKFKAISVREKSGINILQKAGINNGLLLPDPTLLLTAENYNSIIQNEELSERSDFFFYVLQKHQNCINKIYRQLEKDKSNKIVHSNKIKNSVIGIETWLNYIKNTKFVITNSFHGVVFSIIFNTPFVVAPIEGRFEGMNDRIVTLLESYDLKDRIIWQYDLKKIDGILKRPIDWNKTKAMQINMKLKAIQFFTQNINQH